LLTNTVTRSLVVWYQGKTFVTSRHFGVNPEVKPGPILKQVLEKQKPVLAV